MAKYAVGDKVTVGGVSGEIVEVPEYNEKALALHGQLYTVRLEAWLPKKWTDKNGNEQTCYVHPRDKTPEGKDIVRDHECDTLGAVPEDLISSEKHAKKERTVPDAVEPVAKEEDAEEGNEEPAHKKHAQKPHAHHKEDHDKGHHDKGHHDKGHHDKGHHDKGHHKGK